MVALRTDLEVDALGRSADDRRLLLLGTNAAGRLRQARWAAEGGALERAKANGRLGLLQLAERADIYARKAREREATAWERCPQCLENDQECAAHSVRCVCERPWGCSDRCVCFGVGMRGAYFANVDCGCWDHDEPDEPEYDRE